ncbi:MAG: hypothetical protein JJE25_05920, partial [Bacteroidia bacterium]|nr:hypothetical protein [Bacteroidia bacterium]
MAKNIYSSAFSLRKITYVLIFSLVASFGATAQVANYAFSQFNGTYTALVGGAVLGASPTFNDDTNYPLQNIGFTFNYNGAPYTQIGISDNGYIRLGAVTLTYYGTVLQNQTNSISPLNADMLGNSATHQLSYLTTGLPGSQVMTIEWFNWGFYNITGSEINFQIKLYEADGAIEFVYDPSTALTTRTVEVGLNGTPVTDFNNRTTTTDWTATTAGPTNAATCTFSSVIYPPSGLTFRWVLAPIDMSPISLVTPAPNTCYTTTETVTVRVQNFGSLMIDFSANPVTVSCSSTNTNPQVFPPVILNSGTLAVSATQDVVITNSYDMTVQGMYTFTATTSVTGDGNPSNDNMAPVNVDGNIVVGVASAMPASDTICAGATVTLILTGYTGGIQWQSFDGVAWNNETGPGNNTASYTTSPIANTDYRAVVCGTAISNTVSIIVITVAPPTTTGDTRCGFGTVNLSASGVGTLNWYTNPTGGTSLNTGNTYSPTVSTTTTFYVDASIGSPNTSPLTTTFASGNGQLGNMFDIIALNSVTITHFDAHMTSTTPANWEIWYRPGTFVGHT